MNLKTTQAITTALSIAMLGATIMVSYGVMQTEAAKSGVSINWCHAISGSEDLQCFPNQGQCQKNLEATPTVTGDCIKKKIDFNTEQPPGK